jgi:hypothetical protein
VAATEGVWVYHTVRHNQSFRSSDCASKVIQKCFDAKFRYGRTKCEAVALNIYAPFSQKQLSEKLSGVRYFTLSTDASNHSNIKLFPVIGHFFYPYEGIQVKLLELQSQPGETSDLVTKYIKEVISGNNLNEKIIAFCGDNTSTNFGGASRKGANNVYKKLKCLLERDLLGIGCGAHIVRSTIQTASYCLPVDVEAVVVNIYSYFYIYTVRVEDLKDFCKFVEIEYKEILGYSKTRWLALMPSVKRILDMFKGLKSYFLSQAKCPVVLKKFFNDLLSEMWLYFIHS